jgi:hypothetical protein
MASSVAEDDAASLAYPLLANRDGTGRGEKGHWVPTGEEGALAAAVAEFADDNRPPPPSALLLLQFFFYFFRAQGPMHTAGTSTIL